MSVFLFGNYFYLDFQVYRIMKIWYILVKIVFKTYQIQIELFMAWNLAFLVCVDFNEIIFVRLCATVRWGSGTKALGKQIPFFVDKNFCKTLSHAVSSSKKRSTSAILRVFDFLLFLLHSLEPKLEFIHMYVVNRGLYIDHIDSNNRF